MTNLSKSQYIKGCQCPKALWFSLNRQDLAPPPDPSKQAAFDGGREVGDWAKKYFPSGVEVTAPYHDAQGGAADTRDFIADGHEVIFEASAVHMQDGTHARIDILRKVPGANAWDMIEIKGSTSVKDYHHDDMAFQYRAFTGAGYRINRCYMMLIDNSYVRNGAVDPSGLFKLEDITEIVLDKQVEVGNMIPALNLVLSSRNEPETRVGARCFKPFECDYIPHCWGGIPDYNIYNVLAKNKADEIVESLGSYEVKDLPAHLIPRGTKSADVQSHISGWVQVKQEEIRKFLSGLQYPLYYLDYETLGSAVPLFDGTRPFQSVPFQFSLHIEETPGAELQHREFLHQERSDPRPALVEALLRLCGTQGTIVTYNQAFEEGVNKDLMRDFPQFASAIDSINMRMVDLLVPFRNRWLYHPSQKGSASIKKVLPAFVPDLSYDRLGIGNGQDASQKYLDFMQGKIAGDQVDYLWRDLTEYCGLDTYAMKALVDVLREKSRA
jgi:hypothetical protein